ncbi:unnamed protein product [Prorocentrum cordatum]|uniref:Uncharacterized protein n=1 Tax=Prorocentrum cordatum TaxID=2364126 RepID=A0ABN9XDK7_9DINO|nr:unnamed protein product [Polarella glacialis]
MVEASAAQCMMWVLLPFSLSDNERAGLAMKAGVSHSKSEYQVSDRSQDMVSAARGAGHCFRADNYVSAFHSNAYMSEYLAEPYLSDPCSEAQGRRCRADAYLFDPSSEARDYEFQANAYLRDTCSGGRSPERSSPERSTDRRPPEPSAKASGAE